MLQKSEFASLSDLALTKGISHSDLISEINQRVLAEYKKLYSEKAKTVEVFVNEESGEIKLMKDREDVTPKDFKPVAEKLARSIIIEKLDTSEPDIKQYEGAKGPKKDNKIGLWIISLIFWGYNLIYIFSAFIFIVNFFFDTSFREDLFEYLKGLGVFGTSFVVTAILTPFISVFTAWRLITGKNYNKIGILFFFFEVPIVVVSLFFSSTFTSPTPFMWFLFVMTLFGLPVILIYLLNYKIESLNLQRIVLFLRESLFLLFSYFAVVFSFFTPLIIGSLGKLIFEFITDNFIVQPYSYSRYFNPVEILITIFFGGIFILFILSLTAIPYFLAVFFAKIFLSARNYLEEISQKENVDRLTLIFALVWFFFFAASSYQPSAQRYIKRLDELKALQTFEEREQIAKELMPAETKIRRVLSDLQNVRSRYLMTKSDDLVKDAYIDELNFNQISASLVQDTFNFVSYPFVYQGDITKESQAISNFEYLFGDTYMKKYAAEDPKNVDLLYRKISVNTDPNKIAAKVSIEEEFQSKISRDQEVVYEFSLPRDSAITDLKLGPNLEFPGTIAPKGAAATTYQREVNRSRDPALLEQTGPNQYRLRIFPVPGTTNRSLLSGKNQKVQFTYNTLITQNGFTLPLYSKQQNVDTKLLKDEVFVNGNSAQVRDNSVFSEEVSETIKSICGNRSEISPGYTLGGSGIFLSPNFTLEKIGTRYECSENHTDFKPSAKGFKIALLIDSSYENKENSQIGLLKKTLKDSANFLSDNEVDVYKFNDIVSKPEKLTGNNADQTLNMTFFGKSNWVHAANWIREFSKNNKSYDFTVVITSDDDTAIIKGESLYKGSPVLIVHDKIIPPYTTKLTGELLQTGGASFNSINEALNFGILEKVNSAGSFGKSVVSTGTLYSFLSDIPKKDLLSLPDWQQITIERTDTTSQLFARKFLEAKMATQTGNLDSQISFLDQTNRFALNNSVVSPFSSLIALVNETQVRNLISQSQNLDRYKDTSTFTPLPRVSNPSFGPLDSFFGVSTLSLDGGGGGASGFGAIGAPSGVSSGGGISIGAGGQFSSLRSFGGISTFIMINILLLGGGMLIYLISRLRLRKKK